MNNYTKRCPQRERKQLKFGYSYFRGHLPQWSELIFPPLFPWNIRKTLGASEADKFRNASITEGIYCLIIAALKVWEEELQLTQFFVFKKLMISILTTDSYCKSSQVTSPLLESNTVGHCRPCDILHLHETKYKEAE